MKKYDKKRFFYGSFGGRYIPELLIPPLNELEEKYKKICFTKDFKKKFDYYLKEYAGRPTPLFFAEKLSKYFGSIRIYLKREDLLHTGAHKINNVIGQMLLAREMGKKRIIAETGAGQHGVATATIAALFGMKCQVYMGEVDMKRQELNVFKMKLLGADVIPVKNGTATLKDAVTETLRDWISSFKDTHYLLGSTVGPYPFPQIVKDFQSVIGKETKKQILIKEGRLPDYILACVGGGSNAAGIFSPFINKKTKLIGLEAGGKSIKRNAASLSYGTPGILHGAKSYLLQDNNGNILDTYSISAGLDYPGVGPLHSFLKNSGKAEYYPVSDKKAIEGFKLLSRLEGIIPAFESAHAIGFLPELINKTKNNDIVIINISGRGDKDMSTAMGIIGGKK